MTQDTLLQVCVVGQALMLTIVIGLTIYEKWFR